MKKVKSCKYYNIVFLFLGLIVFSPVSSFLSMKILHLPLALPELFFLPFFILLREKIKSIKIPSNAIVNVTFLFMLLLSFALISASFSLFAILSNARAWLYLLLAFCLFRNDNNITYDDFLYLAFGAIIGWAIICLVNINNFIHGGSYKITITYGLMLSLPLFYSITIFKHKKRMLLVGIVLTIVIIVFCGTRRVILVAALSVVASVLILGMLKIKSLLRYTLIGIVLVFTISAVMPIIENTVKEISPHLYFRLFTRTEALINEGIDASQDTERFNILSSTYDEMEKSFLPKGFISMQTDTDDNVGHYNDYPLTMLFWIFSWPIGIIILFYLIKITSKNIKIAIKTKEEPPFVCAVCIIIIILLLFLDGSFITYAYATPITGALLGMAIKNANKKKYNYHKTAFGE